MPLARLIDEDDLRAQLDHIRTLRLTRGESTWLRGNTFYGKRWMFGPDFMAWLEDFRMPEYRLERRGDQYELTFEGSWPEAMMWEIPALAVLMELRSRAVLHEHGQVRAAGALRPRHDPALGEDRAAAQAPRPPDLRLRHPAPALVPLAGLGGAGDDRGAGRPLHRLVELPDRHAPRHRGDRHQRPRAADGLRRARRGRRRARRGALQGARELARRLRRQPPDHPARHLRHQGLPRARAGLARLLDRHPHRLRRPRGGRGDRDRLVGEPRPGPARRSS